MGKAVGQQVRDEDVVGALFAKSRRRKALGDKAGARLYWQAASHLQVELEAERLAVVDLLGQ